MVRDYVVMNTQLLLLSRNIRKMKYDKFINIHVSYFDAHIKYFFLGEIEKIFWLEF